MRPQPSSYTGDIAPYAGDVLDLLFDQISIGISSVLRFGPEHFIKVRVGSYIRAIHPGNGNQQQPVLGIHIQEAVLCYASHLH